MTKPKKASKLTVLAICFAVFSWVTIGVEKVYSTGQFKHEQPAAIESFKAPVLRSKKIRAGLYRAEVVQPFTVEGEKRYANIVYMITSINSGKNWSATRNTVIDGANMDLGVDVFPTKKKALWYITNTGRHIDYGLQPNIKVLYK